MEEIEWDESNEDEEEEIEDDPASEVARDNVELIEKDSD